MLIQISEPRRQFYLSMLGVHLWYARQPLPGAAPSPEFVFPAPRAETPPALREHVANALPAGISPPKARPTRQSDPAAAARIADLRSLMQAGKARVGPTDRGPGPVTEVNPGPAIDLKPAPVSIPASQSAVKALPAMLKKPSAETFQVSLTVWQGERISLIAALSSDASAKLQHLLAKNILRSAGEAVVSEGVTVRWPVFNNLLVRGNQPQDLVGVLRPLLTTLKDQRIIVLGISDSVQRDHLSVDDVANDNNPQLSSDEKPVDAVLPGWLADALPRLVSSPLALRFSLAELAARPLYKRQLWLAIRGSLI